MVRVLVGLLGGSVYVGGGGEGEVERVQTLPPYVPYPQPPCPCFFTGKCLL